MENFWQYRLTKDVQRIKLKKGVLPHRFDCQLKQPKVEVERKGAIKRRRLQLIEEAEREIAAEPQPGSSSGYDVTNCDDSMPLQSEVHAVVSFEEKGVQVNITPHFRSKGTNTLSLGKSVALSPIKVCTTSMSTSPIKIEGWLDVPHFQPQISAEKSPIKSSSRCSSQTLTDDSEYKPSISSSDDDVFDEEQTVSIYKRYMLKGTLMTIERQPKLLLGLPADSYFLIKLLSDKSQLNLKDILIVLKKIRLNDAFAILALDFGMSISNVSRIFSKALPVLSGIMRQLILWPENEKIRVHLPIPFRARYKKVVSIIDCLEIQIEKPSNPIHQALTWSQYKGCNTLKYLISCTPDGLVNFISEGYGGRASDVLIVEDCGFLDKLHPNMQIMSDRGFKNISHLLQQKGCELVRPPSVAAGTRSTAEEVKHAKRIAALRIHVERVIGRLREFNMLLPHACIDNHLIPNFDYVINIACGIINLQDHLIKTQI